MGIVFEVQIFNILNVIKIFCPIGKQDSGNIIVRYVVDRLIWSYPLNPWNFQINIRWSENVGVHKFVIMVYEKSGHPMSQCSEFVSNHF